MEDDLSIAPSLRENIASNLQFVSFFFFYAVTILRSHQQNRLYQATPAAGHPHKGIRGWSYESALEYVAFNYFIMHTPAPKKTTFRLRKKIQNLNSDH